MTTETKPKTVKKPAVRKPVAKKATTPKVKSREARSRVPKLPPMAIAVIVPETGQTIGCMVKDEESSTDNVTMWDLFVLKGNEWVNFGFSTDQKQALARTQKEFNKQN